MPMQVLDADQSSLQHSPLLFDTRTGCLAAPAGDGGAGWAHHFGS